MIKSQISVLEANGESLGARYGGWDDSSKPEMVEDDTVHSALTVDSAEKNAPAKEITNKILEQYTSLKEETTTLEAAIDKASEDEGLMRN